LLRFARNDEQSNSVLAARFLIRTRAMSKPFPKKLAAKNPTFVRSIQQWTAGSITVGCGTEEKNEK
jgi:hypothetical protein